MICVIPLRAAQCQASDQSLQGARDALEKGAIELTLPEVKIDLDKRGEVTGAHLVKNKEGGQAIYERLASLLRQCADGEQIVYSELRDTLA